jgi:L-fuconolactonase
MVLDHIAKPNIKGGEIQPWKEQIEELASNKNLHCKVSGMITEAAWNHWRPEQFRPYLDAVHSSFGADRLMYGSDWPVCLLSGEYRAVYQLTDKYLQKHSASDQDKFFGLNAAKFYGLETKRA